MAGRDHARPNVLGGRGNPLATTNTRTANRSPVTLKIKFKSETLNQFIERYSVDISHGGIFIRTKDPLPVGTALRFEFQLKDASPLITGDGTVVWTREFDPTRSGVAPGMGVRFDRLPSESQEILEQILAYKSAKLGGDNASSEVPAFLDVPTKVAQVGPGGQPLSNSTPFGEVPTRVTPAHVLKSLQQGDDPRRTLIGIGMSQVRSNGERDDSKTPLPRPLPFHADLDEFPDEAFEEATKVAELEALAKKSAEEQIDGYGASMDDDVTMQRNRRPTAPAPEAVAAAAAASAAPEPAPESKFQAVAAFDRAMRSGMPDDDDDEGVFAAHSDRMNMASAQSMPQQAPQEYRPQAAMAGPPEDVERDGGSSLPWIIAAAIVLVVASIGGFLLLNGNNEKTAEEKKDQPTVPLAGKQTPTVPAAAPTDPPEAMPPVKPGLEMVVTSVPEGAMAELVGENQSGTTPMTFRGLEKGKKYTVKLSSTGFADKEMTFEAGGDPPKAVDLVAKPVVLKVTSTPPINKTSPIPNTTFGSLILASMAS